MRKKNGFSLILVMSLGLISVFMAIAVTASLIPIYSNMGVQSSSNVCASAAEIAMQYAIAKLNTAAGNNMLTSVTSPIPIPVSVTNNVPVMVTMSSIDSTDPNNKNLIASPIYNATAIGVVGADYRLLTAVAIYGLQKSTIKVIVGPALSNPGGGKSPFFSMAAFGSTSLELSGNVGVQSEGGLSNVANIGSNSQVRLLGSNVIDGSVNAAGSNSQIASIIGSTTGPTRNATINGDLNYNGNMANANLSSRRTPFVADNPADPLNLSRRPNVLGDAKGPSQIGNQGGTINSGAIGSTTAPAFPQVSDQFATMTANGSDLVSVTGPTKTGQVLNLGTINLTGNTVLILPPGNYIASSLSVSDNAQIQISAPSFNATGVNITLQGNSSGPTALNLGGRGIVQTDSSAASNFQIFYNGSKNIQIDMVKMNSPLYGLLYAPNADIKLDTSNNGAFHGALLGNNVVMMGKGTMSFDPASISPSAGSGNVASGPGYTPPPSSGSSSSTPTTQLFNILSWQEPTRAQSN